ncbi:hypothetical protein EU527_03210 [Candidatus Thorarchaeota archaeon]|nr:MAG: hypothetical protein EU527_03210 [Candidatus Thorarchaeota archaeon]
MSDGSDTQNENKNKQDKVKMRVLSATSYLLPLTSSIPPFWGGIMTLPFLFYLVGMIGNLQAIMYPRDVLNLVAVFGSLLLIIYCIVYLWRKKGQTGLVTTGPYRFVRHPQYFSVTIFTSILTYQSVWILRNTRGIGWLNANQTILLWIVMLVAYVLIAWVEEIHLSKLFGTTWEAYQNQVGFLIPFVNFKSRLFEGIVCLIIPIVILYTSMFFLT